MGNMIKEDFVRVCKKEKASLYVIKCSNKEEVFYKVGITSKNTNYRFRVKSLMPYNYKVIKIISSDPESIFDLEKILHKMLSSYKYKPKIDFGGFTECFTTIKPIMYLLINIKTSLQSG